MTFQVDGDIRAIYGSSIKDGKGAVKRAVGIAGAQLQATWRGQVGMAGLGTRLANSVRKKVYPLDWHPSFKAAAMVYAQPNNKPTASAATILDSFERGVTIRSANGFFLAIPLAAAGVKVSGKKITPAGWERRTGRRLVFIYRKGRNPLLVDQGVRGNLNKSYGSGFVASSGPSRKAKQSIPIFVLIPQARLPKKLNLMMAADAAQSTLAAQIITQWRDKD